MPKGRPREFDLEKALDAALHLFWRHGYEGTSLAALAQAMNINMPSLYAAFGNKQTLFMKALERYMQKHASYFPNSLPQPTARKVVETLFNGAIDMATNPKNPDGCMLVQGALATGPDAEPIRKELANWRNKAEAALAQRFQLALKAKDLPPKTDPAKLARYITTLVWGLSVQAAGGATRTHLRETTDLALEHFPTAK